MSQQSQSVHSSNFYLKLQTDRKVSVSIKYNQKKEDNEASNQTRAKQMYQGFLGQKNQERNSSLYENTPHSSKDSPNVTQKQTLRTLLFSKKQERNEQNNYNTNSNVINSNQNSTEKQHRRLILSNKIDQSQNLSNPNLQNYFQNDINSFNNYQRIQRDSNQNSFEGDLLFYESHMKSKNFSAKKSRSDSNPNSPQRCLTPSTKTKRRFSNQLLRGLMNTLDKSRVQSSEKKIKDTNLNQQYNNSFSFGLDVLKHPQDQQHTIDLKESVINQEFLKCFKFFNKKFIEDHLSISLLTDKNIQYVKENETTTKSDVMMSIQINEKTSNRLEKYEDEWKQIIKIQNKYNDKILYNKLSNKTEGYKYKIQELVFSPYDLYILIEDSQSASTKKAVEFLILNSYKNDRISLIYIEGSNINNTPLLNCTNPNKHYLLNTLSTIKQQKAKQDQILLLFDKMKMLVQERLQTNFLTSIFWFTQGVNQKITQYLTIQYNLINKRIPFQVNIFEYDNENIKSNIQTLAFQSNGNYYLIPKSEIERQVIPLVTDAVCQLKRTIGFKCSGMIRNSTQIDQTQHQLNNKKKTILPIVKVLNRYGGWRVWKHENIFQGNQVLIPYIMYDSEFHFNIKYEFQLVSPFNNFQLDTLSAQLFKVVCLAFTEQKKNSDYIFKQNTLDIVFKQSITENLISTQDNLILNENNLNYKVLGNLLKFEVINHLSPMLNIKDINYIQNEIKMIQTNLKNIQEFNSPDIQQEKQKILQYLEEINSFSYECTAYTYNKLIENTINSLISQKPYFKQENS